MKNFNCFYQEITEATKQLSSVKVGKDTVTINKEGSKFVVYVNKDKLDTFRSQKDAEKAIEELIKLMGG